MGTVWVMTIASVLAVSAISFIGALSLSMDRRRLQPLVFVLVSLAVGAMFGDVFLHLLPESFERTRGSLITPLGCLGGILLFFVLEKFLLWRHDHAAEHTHPVDPVGYINLIADGLHNFIDGMLIGASYLVSVPVGVGTTLAVLLHEIPQEIGDFGVLLHAGFSRARALWLNVFAATLAVAGAAFALLFGAWIGGFSVAVLPVTAGGFIYIAGCDLVPELHKERQAPQTVVQLLGIGLGVGLMLLLVVLG